MSHGPDAAFEDALERRAREIFEAVVDLDDEGRRRELGRSCDGDAGLRERVDRLLAGDRGDPAYLAAPFWETSLEGRRLGRYRIGARIGEGGSGTVHLAERIEGDFAHRVAVKFLKRAVASEASRRRFERERTILAALSHSGIAGLLDGGTTDDGVPFVVMEYVEGSPITTHCDAAGLTVPDRLRLLQRVCDAVSYAHASLVIHRDLKPGNILVTRQGVPKLLDFGIAKLLEPDTDETTTDHRVLTAKYASPEQLLGVAVTTASDVYSLGVLLHELLVGQVPYRREGVPRADPGRPAAVAGFVRPSRRVALATASGDPEESAAMELVARRRSTRPNALARQLAGDLDEVARRALEPDPRDRYASPADLSRDLDRYLNGLPVSARPLSLLSRGAKLARRRPDAALLVGLILLLSVFGAVQSARWMSARDASLSDRRALTGVEEYLVESLRLTDPDRELMTSISAREALERAAARVDRLSASPQAQVSLATTIADGYLELGLYPEARARFERAATLAAGLPAASRGDAAAAVDAGRTRVLVRLGEAAQAADVARAALAAGEGKLAPPIRAKLSVALAEAALELHELDEAESLARAAFGPLGESGANESREAFAALDVLTRTLEAKGDLVAAEALARETLAGLDRRGDSDRADRSERTIASTNLGLILYRRGDAAGAEAELRDVVRRRRSELPPGHPALADALNNLGMVEIAQRRTEAADALLLEALAIWRATLVPTHQLLADVLYNLGFLRRHQYRLDEADRYLRESMAVSERRYGPGHPNLAGNYSGIGWLGLDRGRPREAQVDFEKAVAAAERSAEPDRQRLGLALIGRAVARIYLGEFGAAEVDLSRALEALRAEAPAPPNASAAAAFFARCQVALLRGELDRADAACAAGIEQLAGSVGPTNIWVLELRAHRAFLDVARGKPDVAAASLAPLVEAISGATGDDPGAGLNVRFLRALALAESNRQREAERELDAVGRDSAALAGGDHPDTLRIRIELAALRLRLGEASWLADIACLLRRRAAGGRDAPVSCPGSQARIELAFPAATARPRQILSAGG